MKISLPEIIISVLIIKEAQQALIDINILAYIQEIIQEATNKILLNTCPPINHLYFI